MNLTRTRSTVLIGIAAIVLVTGLVYALVLSPRQSDIAAINAETVAAEDFNRLQQAELADLRLKAENLPAEQVYADGLRARFPATAAQPTLFAEVQAAAIRAGLSARSVIALTPSAPLPGTTGDAVPLPAASDGVVATGPPPATVASMQVEVTVAGPYAALLRFVAEMERNPRAYLISTVDLVTVGEEGAQTYTLTLSGSMFVMPAFVDPTVPVPGS